MQHKKNILEIPSFYISVPQTMIVWFPVPQILAGINGFFLCPFGPILPFSPNKGLQNQVWKMKKTAGVIILHLCNKNHDMIEVWFLGYRAWQTDFCHFGSFYALLHPPPPSPSLLHNPENHHSYVPKILIIWPTVLGICSMKDWNWQFWVVFCPLGPLTTQKIKLLKKWKNRLELLSFYTCVT